MWTSENMVEKQNFYCQFKSYSNQRLAKAACGITSIAVVLSALGVLPKKMGGNLDSFMQYVLSLHKNNVDAVKRKFVINNTPTYITVGFPGTVKIEDNDVVENDGIFNPVFILTRGYDHRASAQIFEKYDVKASLVENYTAYQLFQDLLLNKFSYFLASVVSTYSDPEATIEPTHIVIVQKATISEDGVKYLYCVDTSKNTFEEALEKIPLEYFSKVYNNFGTKIYERIS